jgi:hypothetical protein
MGNKRESVIDESGREYTVPAKGEAPAWYDKALPMEGRATFLPFQDSAPGSVMNKRELALPGIVAGAVNALTAPGRAISGSDPTFNAPEEAANVAMNVMGGGMGATAVKPVPAGSLGMFVGKTAKTWNPESHAQALQMEKAGSTPTDIWSQTGNWKGPEGAWRQEISDKESKITDDVFNSIKEKQRFEGPMSQALSHQELYKANPELGDISAGFFADATPGGSYNAETNSILAGGPSTGQQRSTALHELQHAIQQREGFALGGSPDYATALTWDAKNKELTPLYSAKSKYEELSSKAGELSHVNYLKKLEKLSTKDGLKPSAITNMSPFYEYSDKIRSNLGAMPKKAGNQRNAWLKNAAQIMLFEEKNQGLMPEYKLNNYMARAATDLKNEAARVDRPMDKLTPDYKQYQAVSNKYSNIEKLSDHDKYMRLAGEAEARATQARRNMTDEERRAMFPEESYDVPMNELIVRKTQYGR